MVTRVAGLCLRRILQQTTPGASTPCPRCIQQLQRLHISSSTPAKEVWEPKGLNKRPLIPEYDTINMKMFSYDCAMLESFAKFTKKVALTLHMDILMYPVPRQTNLIKTYRPFSTIVTNEYTLDKYERVIRIHTLPSTLLPVFIEIMRINIPSGVDVEFKQHTEEDETIRYMGDQERKQLMAELEALGTKKKD